MPQIIGVHTDLIGEIKVWAHQTIPQNHLICDGSAISRTAYPALYNKIGTTYGTGDGSTTFNLPDFRAQFLRGAIASSLNSISGSSTVATNNATFTSHGLNRTGFKVRLLSGTLTGLSTATDYYAIVVDTNTLAFATTRANALAGTKIAISGTNTGVIGQYEDPDNSSRVAHNSGANSSGVGTIQEDADQKVTAGPVSVAGDSFSALSGTEGAFTGTNGSANRASPGTGGTFLTNLFFDSSRVVRTSTESRVKNTYVNYIIKVL